MGRPSSYSQEVADEICKRIGDGESLNSICRDDKMPGRNTVRVWLRDRLEFRAQYARAREDQADTFVDEIKDIADNSTPEDWTVARLRVQARQWAAGKLAPKGLRHIVSVVKTSEGGSPIPTLDLAIELAESGFGAQGLLQIVSKTHRARFEPHGGVERVFDPAVNLRVGAEILRDCLKRNGERLAAALECYIGNPGSFRAERYATSPAGSIRGRLRAGEPALENCVIAGGVGEVSAWRAAGLELPVTVNVSAMDLRDEGFVGALEQLLADEGVPKRLLSLEITERGLMADPDWAIDVSRRLSALGVRLSLDDFGTGSSSLAYLGRLPVDEVKIDRSFVRGMTEAGSEIVRYAAQLGRALGLDVVAEGVEDGSILERLVEYECNAAQGFYFSRPLPAAEFERWLRRRRPRLVLPQQRVVGL